jgi:hypothetical protein
MTTTRTRTWNLPLWILVAQTLALATLPVACDEGDDGDDIANDDDDDGPASMATTAPGEGGEADEGGERVCGIIDPNNSVCDACAAESCCAASEACGNDAECNMCFFTPADVEVPAACVSNAAYLDFASCLNAVCATPCGLGGGGSGGEGGGSCNQTQCTDGPGGNAACQAAGCGDCSFGYCLVF